MNAVRPRFSIAVWMYLVTFFFLLGFLPLILSLVTERAASHRLVAPSIWVVFVAFLLVYVSRRCSSQELRFDDGLLWVTASMMTGWLYMSFLVVFPALFLAFSASVLFSLYGDIRRVPGFPQSQWGRMVRFFYRNRMRQQ